MSPLVIMLISFAVLLAIGAPIYLALIIPSIVFIVMDPVINMTVAATKMAAALNSFPLMAVPFFILAGNLMNGSSVTGRIFDFANKVCGHWRGGLGYVNILASVIFAGMSGTALADVGGLGKIELKAMRDAGYPDDFSLGITAASGCIGPIIPPSVPFVVFAAWSGISTGALFFAGIVPGVLMAICLCIMCYVISKKKNFPRERKATAGEIWTAFRKSLLALLMPIIVIGGLWTGWFTATEAAMIAIIYAAVVAMFVYRDLSAKQFVVIVIESVTQILAVLLIVIGAQLFTWILTYVKLDVILLNFMVSVTENKYVIILMICAIVFLMGMVFESTVTYLLLIPLLQPLVAYYGLSMVHLGVVIVFGCMIGLITPPVGMSLFVLSSVTGYKVSYLGKACAIWLPPLVIAWLIIALVEPVSMMVPRLLGFAS